MSEQRAGRGEGLAGRDTIDTLKNLYDTRGLSGAELLALREAIAALEAAAPPGTAPGLRELIEELTPLVDFYLKREIESPSNHQEFAREASVKLDKWYELASIVPPSPTAALATPPPQAPQEQCNAFSTASAREQSAATASDGPCVGDDEEVNCCKKHRIAFSKDKCDICHLHALATRLAAGIPREGATRSHGPTDVHAGTVGPPKTPCVCAEEYVGPQCVNYYRCDRR